MKKMENYFLIKESKITLYNYSHLNISISPYSYLNTLPGMVQKERYLTTDW